jgi:hypothetical protein
MVFMPPAHIRDCNPGASKLCYFARQLNDGVAAYFFLGERT